MNVHKFCYRHVLLHSIVSYCLTKKNPVIISLFRGFNVYSSRIVNLFVCRLNRERMHTVYLLDFGLEICYSDLIITKLMERSHSDREDYSILQ